MPDAIKRDEHPFGIQNSIDKRGENQKGMVVASGPEGKVVSEVFNRFRRSAFNRDRQFQYLDKRTITQYINDCVGRFITNFDERAGIEDWQARVNVPMTHNKVIAILGKIISILPQAEVTARFDDDTKKAKILSDLYEFTEELDSYDELMICAVLEALVKGTVVGFEGYECKERTVRDVIGYDIEKNPRIKEKKIYENKLYGYIVPLEEFYPSSVSIRRIEDMPYCFRRYVIPYSTFIDDFAGYARWDLVKPKMTDISSAGIANKPFYKDFVSIDVEDGNVEIIQYYNKDTDEYVLLANGIWLNPLPDFSVAPNPFAHKRLPFWSSRFDTLGTDFFYGKSLVDRLQSMQDVLNVLTNMLLDQSFLTVFPPILTAGIDPIEEDYLRPGRRVPVDTQGLPLNQAFMKLDLGAPSGFHQFILEYTQKILEQSSLDQVNSGTAGVGGRTTSKEIQQAAAGVESVLGVFGVLLNTGIKNKAYLRCANILQFGTDPKSPLISNMVGKEDGIYKDAFNIVSKDNASLAGGKIGKKVYAMYPNKQNFPSPSEVKTQAALSQIESGKPVEIHAITPDYIRNLQFEIRLVPSKKSPETKEIHKALLLEKIQTYMQVAPQLVNVQELLKEIAQEFGDDPAKVINQQQEQQPQQGQDQQQQQPGGPHANGQAANMIQQAMGGKQIRQPIQR